ncbi:hypothetical protein BC834DRAFT_517430 [Gloeopeniophorella convolvens]|nr:hypothetical protein BC834DRAFT_517430 [Gloeopeniophorella convolvens]
MTIISAPLRHVHDDSNQRHPRPRKRFTLPPIYTAGTALLLAPFRFHSALEAQGHKNVRDLETAARPRPLHLSRGDTPFRVESDTGTRPGNIDLYAVLCTASKIMRVQGKHPSVRPIASPDPGLGTARRTPAWGTLPSPHVHGAETWQRALGAPARAAQLTLYK